MVTNRTLFILLSIVSIVFVFVFSVWKSNKTNANLIREETNILEGQPATHSPVVIVKDARENISQEEVEKLLLGQSYVLIEALFGISADKRESEYEKGVNGYTSPYTTVWCTWDNPDGSHVRLGFVDNKLEIKQFIRQDETISSNEVTIEDIK